MEPKITKTSQRVYQTIDLKEVFGVSFAKAEGLKLKIGQALIDAMKERIAKGIDINGDSMKAYSKEYKESDAYVAARKDGTVNLSLSGDMLGAIDVIGGKGNKITIGFNVRKEELKAHRHLTGEGVPVRNFFGVDDDEVNEVAQEFESDLEKLKVTKRTEATKRNVDAFNSLAELRAEVSRFDLGLAGKKGNKSGSTIRDVIVDEIIIGAGLAYISSGDEE